MIRPSNDQIERWLYATICAMAVIMLLLSRFSCEVRVSTAAVN